MDVLKRRPFSPCPPLKDGDCSVYEICPIARRRLVRLDDDDLLCRLTPKVHIPVPCADAHQPEALFLLAQSSATPADIRDFFPGGANDNR